MVLTHYPTHINAGVTHVNMDVVCKYRLHTTKLGQMIGQGRMLPDMGKVNRIEPQIYNNHISVTQKLSRYACQISMADLVGLKGGWVDGVWYAGCIPPPFSIFTSSRVGGQLPHNQPILAAD